MFQLMSNEWKYSARLGFPPLKQKYGSRSLTSKNKQKNQIKEEIKDDKKYVNNRPIKKIKMSIPVLGFEHIFISAKECADALGLSTNNVYTYIRNGWAAKGILKFEYVEEQIAMAGS